MLLIGAPVYSMVIAPALEAEGLYSAAEEARTRPYVEDAEVHVDWFDGNILWVYLRPGATAADARALWCDVLLDAEGGWVEVSGDSFNDFPRPMRRACAVEDDTP